VFSLIDNQKKKRTYLFFAFFEPSTSYQKSSRIIEPYSEGTIFVVFNLTVEIGMRSSFGGYALSILNNLFIFQLLRYFRITMSAFAKEPEKKCALRRGSHSQTPFGNEKKLRFNAINLSYSLSDKYFGRSRPRFSLILPN
jgi:hypothetical protein